MQSQKRLDYSWLHDVDHSLHVEELVAARTEHVCMAGEGKREQRREEESAAFSLAPP